MTYTYALLEVSEAAYEEVAKKLREGGYDEAFHEQEEGVVIDMHGIALVKVKLVALLLAVVFLSGCASTLTHPVTGQQATCTSGWWLGGGTGIAGVVMGGIALVGNALAVVDYRGCVDKLKAAGFQEPPSAAPEPSSPDAESVERQGG